MKKEEVISKKELIGLNHNRNLILYLIWLGFIIIGTQSYTHSSNWKAMVVTIFGGIMLFFQMNYLIKVGNKYKELCKQ